MNQLILMVAIWIPLIATAQVSGVGGGGDEQERRVSEIREDIRSWILHGGSDGLKLPDGITLENYNQSMLKLLAPQAVVVGFTTSSVMVAGIEKTCAGSKDDDHLLHIQCNISRFKETDESGQYRLIHHEFAGLADLEHNVGAASDYVISDQLTSFLELTSVLRLAVKRSCHCPNFAGVYYLYNENFERLRKYMITQDRCVSFTIATYIRGHGDEPATATDIYYIDSKDHKEVRQDREFHIIGHFTQSEATISTLIKTSTGEKKLLFTNQFILNPITSSITRLYSSPSELGYPVSSQMEK